MDTYSSNEVHSHSRQPMKWLTTGIVIGVVLAHLGMAGITLAVLGLGILAYHRGYRITLSKPGSRGPGAHQE